MTKINPPINFARIPEDKRICFTPIPENFLRDRGMYRAVSLKGSYWKPGETIEYYLFNKSSIKEVQVLEKVMREIEGICNIKFKEVLDKNKSDIRISFQHGAGSWSYIGTQALFIPKTRPTLNIGWLDPNGETMRHELGHALGLLHEHQNPANNINWDREAVIEALSGPPNNWSIKEIEHNVLNSVSPATVNYTSFDGSSVMLYFFPASWTLDGKGTKQNSYYSEVDKKHLKELYPFPEVEDPTDIETGGPDCPPCPECPECPDVELHSQKEIKKFLLAVFNEEKDLGRLLENQVVTIASRLGVLASEDDLKRDTIKKVWSKINNN